MFNKTNIRKEIIDAKPPLLAISVLWNAWGLLKSLSSSNPLNILWDSFWIIKNAKKLKNVNIDSKLNYKDSLCIRYYFNPLLFFFTI